jgi:drug/metabolite transporter (DMT)-like permease
MNKSSLALGIIYIVSAFFFVAVMGAISKLASGITTEMLVFFQAFVALLLWTPWVLRKGVGSLKTSHIKFHLVRAIGGLGSQVLMLVAVRKMVFLDAVLLSNSAPLFIPLLSWVWLKKKVSVLVWVSLVVGLVGVTLILKPSAEMFSNPAALLALASALFSAFALVCIHPLAKTESSERVLFYYFLISSLITLPFALTHWSAPTLHGWFYLFAIGASMALAQLLIYLAYEQAPAGQIAPFNYSVVVFSALMGWLLWQEVPNALSFFGILLVTAGGVISAKFGNIENADENNRKTARKMGGLHEIKSY